MNNISVSDWLTPVLLSLKISLLASMLVFLLGVLAGWWMSRTLCPGRSLLDTVFMLPLVLPPTVVGFLLLMMIGRKSMLGQFAEWWLGHSLVFTWWAAVAAAVVMAFPLVYQTAKTGFAAVDPELEHSARSAGASEWQVLRYITLPLTKQVLASAFLLGFARSLGEFGATFMVAGGIPGQTQTMPTAIYQAVESGHFPPAWYWTLAIVVISFLMLRAVNRTTRES